MSIAYQTSLFAYQGSGQFAYQEEAGVTPVSKPMGFYGVSFRRKRRPEQNDVDTEVSIGETIRQIISPTIAHPNPTVQVITSLRGEDEELVDIKITDISKDDMDVIIIAILASEL